MKRLLALWRRFWNSPVWTLGLDKDQYMADFRKLSHAEQVKVARAWGIEVETES